MIAFAMRLRARGHEPYFVAPTNFLPWIRSFGFDAVSDGIDVFHELHSAGTGKLMSLRWQLQYFTEVGVPRLFDSVARASEGADVIIGSGVQVAAASVAEWRGVPGALVSFCPCLAPSSATPPPTVRTQSLPRFINRLLWILGVPIANMLVRGPINARRIALGLEPVSDTLSHLIGPTLIVAADRELAPLGDDAVGSIVSTDAWVLDPHEALDPRVDAFLSSGDAPIYFGFGSMIADDAPALADQSVAAARALGRRALVVGGWAGLDRLIPERDDVLAVESVAHEHVLPRVAAAVHHGGAGTTTAVARAGVPHVVLPHILDQFYWARRVAELGLGPQGLPVPLVNVELLAGRLAAALDDPRIRERAATFAPAIASRSGLDAGVDAVEALHGADHA
jgi:vancomycin aglycone glucosyltransferase